MVEVYIGSGKGKTTACLGLALRASGWGKKVYIAQFLKDSNIRSGEVQALKKVKSIKIERFFDQVHPMFLRKDSFDKNKTMISVNNSLEKLRGYIIDKKYDIFILDEILNVLSMKLVSSKIIEELINISDEKVELVFTGRKCPQRILAKADYVSLIDEVKHPYSKGVLAREGIEY